MVRSNDYFGLSFDIPKDWAIASEQEKEQLVNNSQDAIAGDDEELGNQLDYTIFPQIL